MDVIVNACNWGMRDWQRRADERLRPVELYQADSENRLLARLSDGQRDCLKLVGQYLSSKEIARQLDISPHTVDQRLKRATALLEVPTRFDAARLFMKHHAAPESADNDALVYEPLVYQQPDLATPANFANLASSPGTLDRPDDEADGTLHEYQERYFATASQGTTHASPWPVLLGAGRENTLSVHSRIAVMVLIAILAVLGFAALVSVAEGLSRLS